MARYFFDIQDGFDHRDEIGQEIESPQALRREALRVMTGLVADEDADSVGFAIIVSVRDATGANVLTLRTVCQFDEPEAQLLRAAS